MQVPSISQVKIIVNVLNCKLIFLSVLFAAENFSFTCIVCRVLIKLQHSSSSSSSQSFYTQTINVQWACNIILLMVVRHFIKQQSNMIYNKYFFIIVLRVHYVHVCVCLKGLGSFLLCLRSYLLNNNNNINKLLRNQRQVCRINSFLKAFTGEQTFVFSLTHDLFKTSWSGYNTRE